MNRLLVISAFLLGASAVIWMGSSFIGSDALALTVIIVIAAVYTIGFVELIQFRQATTTLSNALNAPPAGAQTLGEWLDGLHPSLQNAVRLRIEGDRVGLPAPVITPYLVGLLVMLGLLGTFAGMVDTLKGAVIALEGTTELQAIRAGLAAPIKGLGLAFGTSVAGVATSAMLGLISTLSRRDRMLATRRLDTKIATDFRQFSLTHNRQETYKALQLQATALPVVADRLETLSDKLTQMGDQLSEQLLARQEQFHTSASQVYSDLAASVDRSLTDSLTESGRLAGESIKPFMLEALSGFGREASAMQQHLQATATEQLQSFGNQFQTATNAMLEAVQKSSAASIEQQVLRDTKSADHWNASLEQTRNMLAQLGEQQAAASEALLGAFEKSSHSLMQRQETGDTQRLEYWNTSFEQTGRKIEELATTLATELQTLRSEEERRGEAAVDRLAELEANVASHLARLGKALEEPMTHLIETASETPRAAAEVIGHLRQEISNNIERDNKLLEERAQITAELTTLSGTLGEAVSAQRDAVEKLVNTSTGALREVSSGFAEQVETQLSKMSATSDQFAGSAVDMSSLGEAFAAAVGLFTEANTNLIDSLARMEESMDKSNTRSDEQMGYYVAQAREIIDQSMLSQREIFEELRQLGSTEDRLAAEAS